MPDDLAYFRKRANEERARAAKSARPEVRRVHQELAALYAARVREAEFAARPILQLVTGRSHAARTR